MWATLKAEPIAVQFLVQATISLVCAFGLNLSGVQIAEITTFSAALISVLTRTQVTPNAKVTP